MGEEGEGGMYGENMETYIIICKIDSQWGFAVWLREFKQGLYNNLSQWDGEGNGREVKEWGDMGIPMADSCQSVIEKQENSAKQLTFNLKNK